jgi:nicotinamide-nucleotide amidase
MVNVEIITVGDELLIGQIVDTNSAWMAQALNRTGFEVKNIVTVGDNEVDIEKAFDRALLRSSIILVTGGIGPTKDDITKKTLCKYFDCGLRFDGETLKNMEELFACTGREINPLTYGQAYVPETSTVIQNRTGTAPAMWFEKDGKILVSLPGVPSEMKWLMENEILPKIQETFKQDTCIRHKTLWIEGFTESALAMRLEEFEKDLPGNIRLAYLPALGLIRLRLTGKDENEQTLSAAMNAQLSKLKAITGEENILQEEDKPIEVILGEVLKKKSLTLGIAESCTGGNIAHAITSVPGSSQYFKGAIVAYSNDIKVNLLQVKPSDLDEAGAVSESVVKQMAKGVRDILQTDCSIATSGIAGPDGGTGEKPVGTVHIAVSYKDIIATKKYTFGIDREQNIQRATNMALLMLLKIINEEL